MLATKPAAARFVLSALQQRFHGIKDLNGRLREIATRDLKRSGHEDDLKTKQHALSQVTAQLKTVTRNMALAETPTKFQEMSEIFDELEKSKKSIESDIAAVRATDHRSTDIDAEIDAAVAFANRLSDLATDDNNLPAVTQLIRATNARLYLRFRPQKLKTRMVNKLVGGVLTIGSVPPPIEIYQGPTSRSKIDSQGLPIAGGSNANFVTKQIGSGSEGDSSRNVNRGDRI